MYNNQEDSLFSVEKFESMLKTNEVYFFDSLEFFNIIYHYIHNGEEKLANQALKLGLAQHPFSVELKLIKAEQLIYEYKFDEADIHLNELLTIDSSHEQIYVLKASIYSKSFQHEKAIEWLQTALKYTEDKAEVFFSIGIEYLYLEEYQNAEHYFIKCLAIDFEDNQALSNLILCYEMQELYEVAVKYLEDYIDKNPYNEEAWFLLGNQYFNQKKYEEALKSFDYSLLVDESFLGAHIAKGKTLQKLENYEEAIKSYLTAVEIEDPSAFVYFVMAKCFELLASYDQAEIYYRKAVHEDPQFEKSWLALIQMLIKRKQYKEALAVVENALEMDDSNKKFIRKKERILKKLL